MRRTLLLALAAVLFLSPSPSGCRDVRAPSPRSISDVEFARLIHQLSEEGGYFWSNNYISNETSYLHALAPIDRLRVRGGVYVGVGPNQNFTYIAHIRPRLAFIVDIRRQNMLEHLLFKALMESAPTRHEYLSRLTARALDADALPADAPLEEIVAAIESAPPSHELFRRELAFVRKRLAEHPELELTPVDFQDIERIYTEFFRLGLDIKYDSWRAFFFPTLKEFILETDLDGRRRNWLATHETYAFVRRMEQENRIVPVVGDFAGDGALRRLGALLARQGETVSAFYVSNVEFYLFRQRKWFRFVDNVRHLPIDDRSVFIRAYANLHRPHPNMVGDHITVTLVQNMRSFLRNVDGEKYRSLWDVVTLDYEH